MNIKKSDYKLLVICIILIIGSLFLYKLKNSEEVISNTNSGKKISLLSDYSRFYTINSCVYKYITSIQNNNTDDVIKLLNEKYKNDNNITVDNVYNYTGTITGSYTFKGIKMFYEKISPSIIKYYVYGYLIEDTINGYTNNYSDYYIIVNMDTKNKLFDVIPYDEKQFKEETNE